MAADGPSIFSQEVEITYAVLQHHESGKFFAFLPTLYVMALAGELPNQKNNDLLSKVEEKEAFKLAMISIMNEEDVNTITSYFQTTIKFSNSSKRALPAPICASHIEKEFFSELQGTKLRFYSKNEKKITFKNENTTSAEKFSYYAMRWMAQFLILFAIVELAAIFTVKIPSRIWLLFSLGYVVNIMIKLRGIFDLTKQLMRNFSWMFNKKYIWEGKRDFYKTLRTVTLLAGISYFVYVAAVGAWDATMKAATWKAMETLGASSIIIKTLSVLMASCMALIAAGMSWFGLKQYISSVVSFTVFDNTISVGAINAFIRTLPKGNANISAPALVFFRRRGRKKRRKKRGKRERKRERERKKEPVTFRFTKSLLTREFIIELIMENGNAL